MKIFFSISIFLLYTTTFCQQMQSATGFSNNSNEIDLTYTIGNNICGTLSNDKYIFTLAFLESNENESFSFSKSDDKLIVYNTKNTDELIIQINTDKNISAFYFDILNFYGVLVKRSMIYSKYENIDIRDLNVGIYMARVISTDYSFSGTSKFIKL